MSTFPGALPSFAGFTAGHTLAADSHAAQHNLEQAEVVQVATKIGTGASTPTANKVLVGDGVGTSNWSAINLTTMTDGTLPVNKGGTGTTTSTGTGSVVLDTSPTIVTPTIASFANATHNHQNAAGGNTLGAAAVPALDLSVQTVSNPYKFSVYRNAAANTGNNIFAKITFDTEVFDTNNNFASGTYTAPVAGFYYLSSNIEVVVGADQIPISLELYKNGATYKRFDLNYSSQPSANLGMGGSCLAQSAANDTWEMWAYASPQKAIQPGIQYAWFTGFLVSQT